jgi:hypothetical protein
MSAARFEVGSLSGYPIGPPQSRTSDYKVTSFYVFDMGNLARVVYEARTNSRKGQQEVGKARRRAEAEAARLNADWDAELARG